MFDHALTMGNSLIGRASHLIEGRVDSMEVCR